MIRVDCRVTYSVGIGVDPSVSIGGLAPVGVLFFESAGLASVPRQWLTVLSDSEEEETCDSMVDGF